MGDTLKAESILKDLRTKFADNKNVILELIDLYIKAGKNEEAIENLIIARNDDPDNYSLHFAEGIIYLNEDRYDEVSRTKP